ncbi:MAG: phosphate/phosphite/phosphonate ABC transporter substrate-binding protein [Beijerinckiaceae bacterium]
MTSFNISRRSALATLAAAAVTPAVSPAFAQEDWRKRFPELRMGVSSAENEQLAMARHEPLAKHLTQKLGVPVKVYRVADYAGLVEGMRSGNIEFSRFGPAIYALGRRVMADRLIPILRDVDNNGAEGYYSVIIVKTESDIKDIAGLKGKVIAFADPNSTSGYAFPRYYLKKQGIDVATYFKATPFSGGHDNSVRAVVNGQFDAGAVFWTNETSGIVQRLESRNMVPKGSTRMIWKSPLIPNSPICVRSDMPKELVDLVRNSFITLKDDAPDVWNTFTDGQVSRYAPARHEDYLDVIAVMEENDRERKTRS